MSVFSEQDREVIRRCIELGYEQGVMRIAEVCTTMMGKENRFGYHKEKRARRGADGSRAHAETVFKG